MSNSKIKENLSLIPGHTSSPKAPNDLIPIPIIPEEKSIPNHHETNSQPSQNNSILSENKFLLDEEIEKQHPVKIKDFLVYVNPKIINFKGLDDVGLNYEKMVEKIERNKVKNKTNQNAKISDVLCEIDTGYHNCCGGTSFEGDLNKYGIGISLYFKYIKHLNMVLSTLIKTF